MKIKLSMPSTTSMTIRVSSATHAAGSAASISKLSISDLLLQGRDFTY